MRWYQGRESTASCCTRQPACTQTGAVNVAPWRIAEGRLANVHQTGVGYSGSWGNAPGSQTQRLIVEGGICRWSWPFLTRALVGASQLDLGLPTLALPRPGPLRVRVEEKQHTPLHSQRGRYLSRLFFALFESAPANLRVAAVTQGAAIVRPPPSDN